MAEDSPRTTAGFKKPYKKLSNSSYITTRCSGGFQKTLSSLLQKQTPHIQLSDTTGTSNGTGFYGQMKLKHELFMSKHSRWVW